MRLKEINSLIDFRPSSTVMWWVFYPMAVRVTLEKKDLAG